MYLNRSLLMAFRRAGKRRESNFHTSSANVNQSMLAQSLQFKVILEFRIIND
jgi:hypothetical protein